MIKNVFDIANKSLTILPKYTTINFDKVKELGEKMIKERVTCSNITSKYNIKIYAEVLKELVACSINYCYWYGSHDIRPNGCSSTLMYECVEKTFDGIGIQTLNFTARVSNLIRLLSIKRFPLLEERKKHLYELCEDRKAELFVDYIMSKTYTGEDLLVNMITMFQGFSSDIFLKRASLFFIQLNRKYGWFKDDLMNILPVPADYQVPKILKYFGCIEYKPALEENIYENKLIQKGSIEEIQIRAATIIVCEELRKQTGWTIADVDEYLWTKRKMTDEPFHLTITCDY